MCSICDVNSRLLAKEASESPMILRDVVLNLTKQKWAVIYFSFLIKPLIIWMTVRLFSAKVALVCWTTCETSKLQSKWLWASQVSFIRIKANALNVKFSDNSASNSVYDF